MSTTSPAISVIAPMYNEAGNAGPLAREVYEALKDFDHEIVFVDDASRDATVEELVSARADAPTLRIIRHRRNAGQSRAIRTGMQAARGDIACTLDGDGQNPPHDLPKLIGRLMREDAPADLAMVSGRRVGRKDSSAKRVASRLGNGIRKFMLNDDADDTGCGLKAMKRQAYLELPFFDHQHRFLPALIKREGYRVEFEDVGHRPRMAGRSKYTNLGRLFASLSDMLGVMWLNSRARRTGGWDEA